MLAEAPARPFKRWASIGLLSELAYLLAALSSEKWASNEWRKDCC